MSSMDAYSQPPDRSARLLQFVEAYGEDSPLDWIEKVITCQRDRIDLARALADKGSEPQLTWVANGYLDELQSRVRWSEANRRLFAIES